MSDIPSRPVAVIGAGGHAKVVISTLRAAGYSPSAVFDDCRERWGQSFRGLLVRGPVSELPDSPHILAVVAIGDNGTRQQIAERFTRVQWVTVVHPHGWVDGSASLGPGTVVLAGAVIQADARLGAHVIVNTSATVDHDCDVGDGVHLAPGVHLAGGVRVANGSFLGIGSVVLPGRSIGAGCTVGAGAVVNRDLPDRTTAVGVPAKPLRRTEVL